MLGDFLGRCQAQPWCRDLGFLLFAEINRLDTDSAGGNINLFRYVPLLVVPVPAWLVLCQFDRLLIKRFPHVWKIVREPKLLADEAGFRALSSVEEIVVEAPLDVVREQLFVFVDKFFPDRLFVRSMVPSIFSRKKVRIPGLVFIFRTCRF